MKIKRSEEVEKLKTELLTESTDSWTRALRALEKLNKTMKVMWND